MAEPISVRCYVGPRRGMHHVVRVFVGPGEGRRGYAGSLTVLEDELETVLEWLRAGPVDVEVFYDAREESYAA